jgi:hypothetical protein
VKTKFAGTLLLGAAFALAQTSAALACACCTNTGQRYVENTKLDNYRQSVIGEIRFAGEATLFTDERDLADIKGIRNPSSKPYVFSAVRQQNRIVFSFRGEKNNEGTLTLALPDAIAIFEVDTRDEPHKDRGLGPVLYKEWRLTAPFSGAGIFQAGNGGYPRPRLHRRGTFHPLDHLRARPARQLPFLRRSGEAITPQPPRLSRSVTNS